MDGDGIGDYLIGDYTSNASGLNYSGAVWARSGATGAVIRRFDGPFENAVLGKAVAGIGDINFDGVSDIIATGWTSAAWSGTAVHVYSGADGSELYYYDGVSSNSAMGEALGAGGDINNDGVPDFVIGEHRADHGSGMTGAAYAYSGLDGSLLHQFLGPSINSVMGISVAITGDVNNDSYDDIIVGASSTRVGTWDYAGSAFVYSGLDGSLLHQVDGSSFQEGCGFSVSGVGDVNVDGFDDFLIGSHGNDVGTTNGGAVTVYSGLTGLPIYTFHGQFNEYMGRNVGRAGDVNGDGVPDILAGSFGPGPSGSWAGKAWIYSGADGALLHQITGPNAGDYMGYRVCGIGDVNEDGGAEVLIGSSRSHVGGVSDAGIVHMLGLDPHLHLSSERISNAAGAVLDIDIELPIEAAFYEYRVLMSLSGRGPANYGIEIPLTPDVFAIDSYYGIYPFTTYSNLHGFLDGNGDASASITFPADAYGFAVGRSMWLAAIASQPGFAPDFTTASVIVTMEE